MRSLLQNNDFETTIENENNKKYTDIMTSFNHSVEDLPDNVVVRICCCFDNLTVCCSKKRFTRH